MYVALGVLAPRLAAAAQPPIELAWSSPDDCSSDDDVLDQAGAQLGPGFASEVRVRAVGRVRASQSGQYELDLRYTTTAGARDERHIAGESCAAVTQAAALVLALALDPHNAAQPTGLAAPSDARPPPGPERGSSLGIGMLAVVDTPILDALVAPGGGLRVFYRYAALELSASLHLFVPRDRTRDDVTLRLQLWSIDLGACHLTRISRWALGPCARFEIGRLAGEPRGAVDAPTAGAARVQAATLAATVRIPLWDPWRWIVDLGLEWVARRPQFDVLGGRTIARASPFGARFATGLVWVF